jgi:hypothetical protein
MDESGRNSEVMTVARVFEPADDGVEVVFLESAMFYRLPKENPEFGSMLALLKNAHAEGYRVEVKLGSLHSNVIEGVKKSG